MSLIVVLKGPFDTESSLIHIMALCQTSDKSLLEPMTTQFDETFHQTRMS